MVWQVPVRGRKLQYKLSLLSLWLVACSETGAKQWPEKEFLNPLKDPLPDAPNMKMFCMYGVGAPAERSYHYQHVDDPMVCPEVLPACTCPVTFHVAGNVASHAFTRILAAGISVECWVKRCKIEGPTCPLVEFSECFLWVQAKAC